MTVNHADAHYDLGAGGHGVTTDCHDSTPTTAFDLTTGTIVNSGPHCFAGGRAARRFVRRELQILMWPSPTARPILL